jgi:hypothetical protein
MTHYDALMQLANSITPLPKDLTDKFRQLRAGVDYTQNQADASLDAETWTAARDAADAFEQLERALARLDDLTVPF